MLGCVESVLGLWSLADVGWNKGFIAGLLSKWAWLLLLIRLAESRLRIGRGKGCFKPGVRVLELWMYAHRMARDMLTSSLVVLALLPLVVLNSINLLLCPGCGAHQLLIYRDPGHIARKEALVRDIGGSSSMAGVRRRFGLGSVSLGVGSQRWGGRRMELGIDTLARGGSQETDDHTPLKVGSPDDAKQDFGIDAELEPVGDESFHVRPNNCAFRAPVHTADSSFPVAGSMQPGVAPVIFGSPTGGDGRFGSPSHGAFNDSFPVSCSMQLPSPMSGSLPARPMWLEPSTTTRRQPPSVQRSVQPPVPTMREHVTCL